MQFENVVLEAGYLPVELPTKFKLSRLVTVNTHVHADHITGTSRLKTLLPGCKSMISRNSGAEADILLESFDQVQFGRHHLAVLPTPGHTEGQSLFCIQPLQRACTAENAYLTKLCT